MSYVRSFFKNPHLDFSKINAHFTRKHYCRVCLGRKNRIEHLSGRSILPPLSRKRGQKRFLVKKPRDFKTSEALG